MITVINYANEPYRRAQAYCTKKAYSVGQVDRVIEYGPADIDSEFYERNKNILENKRGSRIMALETIYYMQSPGYH